MINAGQIYRCTNRWCNCEIVISKASPIEDLTNARCFCGSEMKKCYSAPRLREFNGVDADRLRSLFKRE